MVPPLHRNRTAFGIAWLALLAACSAPPPVPAPAPPPPEQSAARSLAPPPMREPLVPPLTLEGYKKEFAQRVALASPELFEDPLPEMFKSIVVLDITIDRDGGLAKVSVRRSNGYKALEIAALNSVHRAAPYAAPSWTVRRSDGSVNFLETFLFRDDGRFQIRSLVAAN
jgi:protein TonB